MRLDYIATGLSFLFQLQACLSQYRMYHTKALYEALTDKVNLNVSINEIGELSLYINLMEEVLRPYFAVHLVVDSNNKDDYDFEVVKRMVDSCKLYKDPTYEPVVQILYKMYLENGNFPTKCPIAKGLYYFKNMKIDPERFPRLKIEKNAFLAIKLLSKGSKKFKPLAFYKVFFAVEALGAPSKGNISLASKTYLPTRPTRPTRSRN